MSQNTFYGCLDCSFLWLELCTWNKVEQRQNVGLAMNLFDSKNPLAPLFAFICGSLALWGIADSACANSEKQICQVWQQANSELAQALEAKMQEEK